MRKTKKRSQKSEVRTQRLITLLLVTCYLLLVTTPVYAQAPVSLNTQYAFGNLISLGSATSFVVGAAVTFFILAVIFYIVIAGIKFIVSEGDKASVSEAKKTITHSLIAIFLFILLFLIVRYVPAFFGIDLQIIR